jgi:hypothetical protein
MMALTCVNNGPMVPVPHPPGGGGVGLSPPPPLLQELKATILISRKLKEAELIFLITVFSILIVRAGT